jgi:prevent-host-death family protein
MPTVSSKDLKNHTGEVLRRVRRGERVTVTNRGKPIATLVPYDENTEGKDTSLEYPTAWNEITNALHESVAPYGSWREAMDGTRRRR